MSTDALPSDEYRDKRYDIAAMAFCFVLLAAGLILGHFHRVGFLGESDFYGGYAPGARDILAGKLSSDYFVYHPPGYALLLAAASFLGPDIFTAGKIVSAIALAAFAGVTYLLLKGLFDSRIALVGTLLLGISLIPYSYIPGNDLIFGALVMTSIWIFLRRPSPSFKTCWLAGMIVGVAYLIRTQAVFFIVAMAVVLLLLHFKQEGPTTRFVKTSTFAGGVLLIILPWLIFNWQRTGTPVAGNNYLQIAAHFYHPLDDQQGTSLRQLGPKFKSAIDVFTYDPALIFRRYITDILFWYPSNLVQTMGFPSYLFAGGGLLFLLAHLSRRTLALFAILLISHLPLGLISFQSRYYILLMPILFLAVAYFLFNRRNYRFFGRIPVLNASVSWVLVLILALYSCKDVAARVYRLYASEPTYVLEVAAFLKDRSSPSDIIVTQVASLSFNAGLKRIFPADPTPEAFTAEVRRIRARYLVYGQAEASIWDVLKAFSDPGAVPADFHLIYRHDPSQTLVYEIRQP